MICSENRLPLFRIMFSAGDPRGIARRAPDQPLPPPRRKLDRRKWISAFRSVEPRADHGKRQQSRHGLDAAAPLVLALPSSDGGVRYRATRRTRPQAPAMSGQQIHRASAPDAAPKFPSGGKAGAARHEPGRREEFAQDLRRCRPAQPPPRIPRRRGSSAASEMSDDDVRRRYASKSSSVRIGSS